MREIFFHVAAGSFVLTGLAHTLAELFGDIQAPSAETARVIDDMKRCNVPMPGRKVTLYQMMRGFSLMMGTLLIATGVLNHMIAAYALEHACLMAFNVGLSATALFLSVRYFFIAPIVLMGLATGAYLAAWLL